MWIFLNTGFISIVQNRFDAEQVVVRSRKPEILTRLFPDEQIICSADADYRYRLFVRRAQLVAVLSREMTTIDYPNFKSSVHDPELGNLYHEIWSLGVKYQG